MARPALAQQIAALVGPTLTMRDVATGWPSDVIVQTSSGRKPVALHVSQASPHSREDWEWRFQNPGDRSPVSAGRGYLPLLVGLDTVDRRPVLIVVDGRSRLGREARFGILFNKRISVEAARTGWSEFTSTSGERILALWPQLLPLAVEVLTAEVDIADGAVVAAVEASGLLDGGDEPAAARARRTASSYVRDARFSGEVKRAYAYQCAMCEIQLNLIVGAHIYPVSAERSPDRVWNGIALCHNHHAAFDAHQLWVGSDYAIRIRPEFLESAKASEASQRFLQQTRSTLLVPAARHERPRPAMLQERYGYYQEHYEWAPSFS